MPPKKHSEGSGSIAEGLSANKKEAMAQILDRLENLTDKSGRMIADLFMELPDREEYPDYYMTIKNPVAFDIIRNRLDTGAYDNDNIRNFPRDLRTLTANAKEYNRKGSPIHRDATTIEIARPIALDGIKKKINSGAYKTLESFEEDFDLMFENAKQYNAEGSDVYLDAEDLQQLFWKEIGKDGRGQAKHKNTRKHAKELTQVEQNGETYRVGDFVHLKNDSDPSKPIIALIFSIWEDENGQRGLDTTWFLRPDQIVHSYASRFYPSEVVKASGSHEHPLGDILGRCFVLYTRDYVRGRPVDWKQGQNIYLCEQRYSEAYKSVSKIKNWASCLPPGHKPSDIKFNLFPEPLVLKKLPSASMVDKAGKHDAGEVASRSSTPQDTSSKIVGAGGNKRNSVNMHPGSPSMAKLPSQPHQAHPQHWVRCNYSSLSTGLQCSAVFANQGELQRHVATEHAILQHTQAPPAMKRGRPRKNPLPSNVVVVSSSVAQAAGVPPVMSQPVPYQPQAYNPYNPAGQYGAPPRPGKPGQIMQQPNVPYPQQIQSAMHHMQPQPQQRGMPYQQPHSQPLQVGQPRPQGFPQGVPYGQPYGQPFPPQHPQYPQQQPQFPQQGFPQGYPQQQPSYPGGLTPQQQYAMQQQQLAQQQQMVQQQQLAQQQVQQAQQQ
ncbi:hypothetical protein BG011_007954, partial [Mortierella polycephala]